MDKKNVFGTLEWASHNENFINGCLHDCLYCYSKEMAIRFKRKIASEWHIEEVREHCLLKTIKKYPGQIMFPSSHDITPNKISDSVYFIKKILESGHQGILIFIMTVMSVTKLRPKFKSKNI